MLTVVFLLLSSFGWTGMCIGSLHAGPLPVAAVAPAKEVSAASIPGQGQPESVGITGQEREQERSVQTGTYFSKQTFSHLQVSLENFIQVFYWRMVALNANLAKLPYDMAQAMNKLSFDHGSIGFVKMVGLLVVVFLLAAAAKYIFRRIVLSRISWKGQIGPEDNVWLRFWMFLLQIIPDVLALLFYVAASYVAYVLIYAQYFSGICPIYLSMLTVVVCARAVSLVCRIFFDPRENRLTLVSLDPRTAAYAYYSITAAAWIVLFGIMFISLFKHAGVRGDSLLLLKFAFGTLLCLLVAGGIWLNRKPIAALIAGSDELRHGGSIRGHLAGNWHLLGLGYLVMLWLFWSVRLVVAGPKFAVAFIVSLFIVPIFLVLDWMVNRFFYTLICVADEDSMRELAGHGTGDGDCEDIEGHPFLNSLRFVSRIVLTLALFIWLLYLWGFPVAFGPRILDISAETVIIIGSAFVIWKIIDLFIYRHLAGKTESREEEEDVDSEWGDAPLLDRSQTLLPLVRKFTAISISVMTFLLILSTLGVNIGPLLAGAGVVGIAIGFGAQKLVSDIFSGFFYLLDDAFRVGEYIEAGSISGAVEKITLRNVMLRHHRGMLQIIPYSDLGAITNFMRGGIVVKFNLQFPYDTDVDVVRKVIKRVGITMLDDPEFGKNFIKQVKSQGIREVGDSILTIRVKFTAKPGTHFVIRREAYRRITEALAAKGIHYAHRKVIVEVPSIEWGSSPDGQVQNVDNEVKRSVAQAGAAAYLAQQQDKSATG